MPNQTTSKPTEFDQMTNPADGLLFPKNQLMEIFSIDKIHDNDDMLIRQWVPKQGHYVWVFK